MQRLAEDRLKRQWEEWQAGQDKEQKKRQLVLDEQWKAQNTVNQEHASRLKTLEDRTDVHRTQIETLLDVQRLDAHRDLQTAQNAVERAEQMLAEGRSAMRGG
jgi:hypothetical protein